MQVHKIEKIAKSAKAVNRELHEKTFGYILTALGLVAGLAWNDAISSLIKYLFPLDGSGILAKFIYAILITVVIVVISKSLMKIFAKSQE